MLGDYEGLEVDTFLVILNGVISILSSIRVSIWFLPLAVWRTYIIGTWGRECSTTHHSSATRHNPCRTSSCRRRYRVSSPSSRYLFNNSSRSRSSYSNRCPSSFRHRLRHRLPHLPPLWHRLLYRLRLRSSNQQLDLHLRCSRQEWKRSAQERVMR